FSSRRRHTRFSRDWSSDVCSSDLSHYSSTLDFSNDALRAAQKGYRKIINGLNTIKALEYTAQEGVELDEKAIEQINQLCENCYRAMNDDFNTALTIGHLFNLLKRINSIHTGNLSTAALGQETFDKLKNTYISFVEDILGLREEKPDNAPQLIETLLAI